MQTLKPVRCLCCGKIACHIPPTDYVDAFVICNACVELYALFAEAIYGKLQYDLTEWNSYCLLANKDKFGSRALRIDNEVPRREFAAIMQEVGELAK